MAIECNQDWLKFHGLGRREVVTTFDVGLISCSRAGLVLRELETRIGIRQRLGDGFLKIATPMSMGVRSGKLGRRFYRAGAGYEDFIEREPRSFACRCVVGSVGGQIERQGRGLLARDWGKPLANSRTLNRA